MVITEKHSRILDNAEALFGEQGYEGTTVRDIADHAGVNLAMISYYFGSKENLLIALFRQRMGETKTRLENIISNQSLTVIQKMEILIDEYINRVMQKQSFYKIILLEQVTNKNTEVVKILREFKISYTKLIAVLIAEGQKLKIIKKDIDIVMLLTTMTGTVTQMVINKDYYLEYNGLKKISSAAFDDLLRHKMSAHVKQLFKATLGYE